MNPAISEKVLKTLQKNLLYLEHFEDNIHLFSPELKGQVTFIACQYQPWTEINA